jgi:hypothetical protein
MIVKLPAAAIQVGKNNGFAVFGMNRKDPKDVRNGNTKELMQ